MRIIRGLDRIPELRHPVATVGSYDGVHGGHRELLAAVCRIARARNGESMVVTFDPHPRLVLEARSDLQLLTTVDEKARLLEQAGIDNLVIIPFTRDFSLTSSTEFIRRDVVGKLGVEALVMGYNHRFGHNKEGGYGSLRTSGLELCEVGKHDIGGEKVSSTVIRSLVGHGAMRHAARLLCHPYLVIAEVGGGRLRISDPCKLLPPAGEYPVTADGMATRLFIPREGVPLLELPLSREKCIIEFSDI